MSKQNGFDIYFKIETFQKSPEDHVHSLKNLDVMVNGDIFENHCCGKCGDVVKKSLSVRGHHCEKCGFETSRDRNTALVLWNEGFKFYGQEQPACADRKVG